MTRDRPERNGVSEPRILAEQDDFVAVDKPAGLLTIAGRDGDEGPTLRNFLERRYPRIFPVHRLDRATSGVILFARTAEAHRYYSGLFERREAEKDYLALVLGRPATARGTVDAPIAPHGSRAGLMIVHRRGKPAQTDFTVLEQLGRYALLRCRIHTGRTHQIRVHLQHLGHPVACDEYYGDGKPILLSAVKTHYKPSGGDAPERPLLSRLALHAERLAFTDMRGVRQAIGADLPKDLRATLQQLRKWT